jgi:flagellar hook protein FlgE
MSFQTGLSGLNASSKSLDVIGHNIANANTTGMKASRAEFAEIYSAALGIGGAGSGIGVSVANTAQLFTQGNLKITGNTLDLAINGEGFFRVQATGDEELYTRNGEFKLDREGFIVTNAGYRLVGYNTTEDGVRTGLNPIALQLPTGGQVPPRVTSEIAINANLDAGAPVQTLAGRWHAFVQRTQRATVLR